jgi:glycosyltransferase involved in cell wall biosynthesis
MKISLVITTYNWKEALDLVLKSVARQSELPDEVVIADDGSRPDTAELIAQWTKKLPVPLQHVWQEDIGFRAGRVRNRAIAAATGDYVVIVDGDMVLHAHFIRDHKRAAQRGYFIQGARVITGSHVTSDMLKRSAMDLGFFAPDIDRRRHTIRNRLLSWLVLRKVHRSQRAIRSCNQGYWKADLIRVNGFDETMTGWGGEDNEIAARLYNVGVYRRNLKFGGLAIHLHHNSRKPSGENPNHAILKHTIDSGKTRCEQGLDQHLNEPGTYARQATPSSESVAIR